VRVAESVGRDVRQLARAGDGMAEPLGGQHGTVMGVNVTPVLIGSEGERTLV
jgi:hypothetical protein